MTYAVLILLFSLLLQGCSQISIKPQEPKARLDSLIEQGQYRKARKLLDQNKYLPLQDHYSPQLGQLEQQLVKETLAKSETAIKAQQWYEASQIVNSAIAAAGKLPALVSQEEKITTLRDDQINEHEHNILLHKGEFLLQQSSDLKAIAEALPRNRATQVEYQQLQQEMNTTAEKLAILAQQALDQGDSKQARKAADLSYQLQPGDSARQLLNQLEQERLEDQHKQQNQVTQARSKHLEDLINEYNKALDEDDLVHAKAVVEEIRHYSPELSDWLIRMKNVDKRIARQVQSAMERGQILYSQGFIQEALDLWKETEKLDPDNEKLKEYISRATRFLENIEKLSAPKAESQ